MASVKKLARALTDEVEGGFRITLEMDDGEVIRVFATEDQLADLADEFDELLDTDDAEEDDQATDDEERTPRVLGRGHMTIGWIVEIVPPSGSDDRPAHQYGVRCTDKDRAKELVLSYASADSSSHVFFLRPMTEEEAEQHRLADDDVGDWGLADPDADELA